VEKTPPAPTTYETLPSMEEQERAVVHEVAISIDGNSEKEPEVIIFLQVYNFKLSIKVHTFLLRLYKYFMYYYTHTNRCVAHIKLCF